MKQAFCFDAIGGDEFVKKFTENIKSRAIGEFLNIEHSGNDLVITINKLGTSVLRYKIEGNGAGCKIVPVEEKIAWAHKAFKSEMEDKLIKTIEKLGGKIQKI